MANVKEIIKNIETLYSSNNSLKLLKDFERVIDELDVYVYENWIDGELVSGPNETRYFVECTFMWPMDKMPEPRGGQKLIEYGCKVEFSETYISKVRKIESPEDIRPGTRKGKIDLQDVWMVRITIPKKLMADIDRGYTELDRNKIADVIQVKDHVKASDNTAEDIEAEQEAVTDDTSFE